MPQYQLKDYTQANIVFFLVLLQFNQQRSKEIVFMLSVEKIGGTSMSRFGEVLDNIILNVPDKKKPYNRIFVISAYGGVTNLLLENKKTGAPGIYAAFVNKSGWVEKLADLQEKLIATNREFKPLGLDLEKADEFIVSRIGQTRSYLQNIAELISSGYVDKASIMLSARELLASIGEAHAAFNSVEIIKTHGPSATFVDLSGFHDSEYLTIDQRIEKTFSSVDCSATVPVVTGYVKGTEGIMRKFDRGYTEVTFAKIAAFLRVDEAVIHKEYHFCSADPGIVGEKNAAPVCYTNYDVLDQLADIWMEAVHPAVSKMLETANINLRIKNAFDPRHPGTLISREYTCKKPKVEIVSGTENVMAIDIHDPGMVGSVGFDNSIMEIFSRHGVSYILKATNANSISIVIRKTAEKQFLDDLKARFFQVTVKHDAAIASVMGTNIGASSILAKAASALADNGIRIEGVSQSLRPVNIQFVINEAAYEKAIVALNKVFFKEEQI
jgi:aspartate kinase